MPDYEKGSLYDLADSHLKSLYDQQDRLVEKLLKTKNFEEAERIGKELDNLNYGQIITYGEKMRKAKKAQQ